MLNLFQRTILCCGRRRARLQHGAQRDFQANGVKLKLFDRILNPRDIRRKLGMNQEQFWTKIGVTQSGGSRYESGRDMPKPVRELLRLVHVENIDLSRVRREDFEIIEYLKDTHPDLYKSLRVAVRSRDRSPGALEESPRTLPGSPQQS